MTVIERWSAAVKYLNSLSKDEVMEYFEAGLHRPLVFCAVRPEDGAACRRHAPLHRPEHKRSPAVLARAGIRRATVIVVTIARDERGIAMNRVGEASPYRSQEHRFLCSKKESRCVGFFACGGAHKRQLHLRRQCGSQAGCTLTKRRNLFMSIFKGAA